MPERTPKVHVKAYAAHSRSRAQIQVISALAIGIMLYLAGAWLFLHDDGNDSSRTASEAPIAQPTAIRGAGSRRAVDAADLPTPVIVLSTGGGLWNTGVWPAWGQSQDPVHLMWAGGGLPVYKTCPVKCEFTHDQTRIGEAAAVLMETVNHPKFLGAQRAHDTPIPWPEKRMMHYNSLPGVGSATVSLPLTGIFYGEPSSAYFEFTQSADVLSHTDFIVSHHLGADVPTSFACPWTSEAAEAARGPLTVGSRALYLNPPPPKDDPTKQILYFSDRGIAQQDESYVKAVIAALRSGDVGGSVVKVDTFGPALQSPGLPAKEVGEPMEMDRLIDFYGKYKFAIVTTSNLEADWVEPEWFQVLAAGTVPIVFGSINVERYAPADGSFINARDFKTAEDLAEHIKNLLASPSKYRAMFNWKTAGLSQEFERILGTCVYHAECRICQTVRAKIADRINARLS